MKFARFEANGKIAYGIVEGEAVAEISAAPFGAYDKTGNEYALSQVKLLAPCEPSKVLATALNYKSHLPHIPGITGSAAPTQPELFYKVPSSIINPGDTIVLPADVRPVEEEAELVVVIGKPCKNVSVDEAMDYVFGYTCGNDVSARDWQKEGGGSQWCRGKSFDTFCPLGPVLVTPEEIPNPNALRISTKVNGETLQDCSTADMIFDVPALLEFLSGSTTLLPGTVILTGTPHGVGMARTPPRWLQPGDTVAVEIEKIGVLTNPVVEERAAGGSSFRL